MRFFVSRGEQQEGPYDEEGIQKMLSEGLINHETLLFPEGGELGWTPAKELFPQDLFSHYELVNSDTSTSFSVPSEGEDKTRLEIRLSSGAEIRVKAICLYDEIALGKLSAKKAEALKKLQGVSTGLGAIGSIEWVLAASVLIGAAEAALSAGAASAGTYLLQQVMEDDRKLRKEGVFCPVGRIQFIEMPLPGLWRVPREREVLIEVPSFIGLSKMEPRTLDSALVHNGDEFLSVVADDGSVCSIRWGAVERYVRVNATPR